MESMTTVSSIASGKWHANISCDSLCAQINVQWLLSRFLSCPTWTLSGCLVWATLWQVKVWQFGICLFFKILYHCHTLLHIGLSVMESFL
jgi:hypothetical protein